MSADFDIDEAVKKLNVGGLTQNEFYNLSGLLQAFNLSKEVFVRVRMIRNEDLFMLFAVVVILFASGHLYDGKWAISAMLVKNVYNEIRGYITRFAHTIHEANIVERINELNEAHK